MPRRTPERPCTYLVRGRPCAKPGEGNPPLCDEHYDELYGDDEEDELPATGEEVLDELLDDVFENPQVKSTLGRVSGFIDRFSYLVDRVATPQSKEDRREAVKESWNAARAAAGQARQKLRQERQARRAGPGRPAQGRPAQPPRPRPAPGEDPMVVLGFPPGAQLTIETVKKRHKQLAQIFHSDKGGSEEAMKRLNNARDQLLAKLRAGPA